MRENKTGPFSNKTWLFLIILSIIFSAGLYYNNEGHGISIVEKIKNFDVTQYIKDNNEIAKLKKNFSFFTNIDKILKVKKNKKTNIEINNDTINRYFKGIDEVSEKMQTSGFEKVSIKETSLYRIVNEDGKECRFNISTLKSINPIDKNIKPFIDYYISIENDPDSKIQKDEIKDKVEKVAKDVFKNNKLNEFLETELDTTLNKMVEKKAYSSNKIDNDSNYFDINTNTYSTSYLTLRSTQRDDKENLSKISYSFDELLKIFNNTLGESISLEYYNKKLNADIIYEENIANANGEKKNYIHIKLDNNENVKDKIKNIAKYISSFTKLKDEKLIKDIQDSLLTKDSTKVLDEYSINVTRTQDQIKIILFY